MKKLIKNPLFTFILGAIICGTTGVIASNLMASNIAYTPKDKTWGVNNVEAAIDSLKISKTSDNYSTDEKVVGTWIDGKPLYQKAYEYESTELNKWVSVADLTALNIDTCMFGGSFVSGNIKLPLPYQDSSNHMWIQQNNSKQLYINTTMSGKLVIVIQYTKTTD